MKPLKNKVSITLDSDVIEQLKLLAEQDDRSFSQYINRIKRKKRKTASVLCFSHLNHIYFVFGMLCAYIFSVPLK